MPDPEDPDDVTATAETGELVGPGAAPAAMGDMGDIFGGLLGGAGAGGDAFDFGSLLGSAMEMQQQLLGAQQAAMDAVVVGQAGGGMVKIEVTGGLDFRSVTIDPEVVDPDDVELLEDLVLAALHDVAARVQEIQSASLGGGFDIAGMLGGGTLDLGNLFGGASPDDDEDDEGDDDEGVDDDDADGDGDDGRAAGRP